MEVVVSISYIGMEPDKIKVKPNGEMYQSLI